MDIKELGEFGLIEEIKKGIALPEGVEGIGDDCAVIPQTTGKETLVSTDMLMEGTHFLIDDISPYLLGWKSAAVNISDIAAMGGRCVGSFLSFALPEGTQKEWLMEFFRGYKEISALFDCPLLGGDTTTSPDRLCINVTVLGEAGCGVSVKRSGAEVGDLICVTGPLGDSACGLAHILNGCVLDDGAEVLIDRHYKPMPRVSEGLGLAAAGVSAMMDISDGIASDIKHIMELSQVGAVIELTKVPTDYDIRYATTGGEDYELLLTIEPSAFNTVAEALHEATGTTLTAIGTITEGNTIEWLENGNPTEIEMKGFEHF
jgi:thiamine-monophosphate kinase